MDFLSISSSRAVLIVTTNPSPSLPPDLEMMWLTMPTTSPAMVNMGPPELPVLIVAFVWKNSASGMARCTVLGRPLGADPPHAERVREPVRRPHHDHLIADAHVVGIAQARDLGPRGHALGLEQRQVGCRLRFDHPRADGLATEELDQIGRASCRERV